MGRKNKGVISQNDANWAKKKKGEEVFKAPMETVEANPKDVEKMLKSFTKKGIKRAPVDEDSQKVDWKKFKADKKEEKLKYKESNCGGSERYNLGVQAKKVWEELRQADCKKDRQMKLCEELVVLVKGKMKSLIYAHDTVRVIETLVAVGGQDYRTIVFEELKDDLVNLSKNKYSRFFVLKVLRYGSKPQKSQIIDALKGQVVKLMKHKLASDVVELSYNDYANAKQRSMMIQEFYGPQFRLFHEEDIKCLADVLKKYPEKKLYILKDFRGALQPIIDKGVFTNTMVHTLLRDFLAHCSEDDRTGIIEALKENLTPIIHTRDGSRVAMYCLWYGTNKDRKVILKTFVTHYTKIAKEEHGHMVLLAAFDCMDDTVFMRKAVLSELMENLDELVSCEPGMRVLRYLIAPRSPTFFQPCVVEVLKQGDGNPSSKKDADIRQRELQQAVSIPILRLLFGNIKFWAVNPNWTLFIGAALKTLNARERESIFYALAEMLSEPYMPGQEGHPLEVAHFTKMLSYIIKCDAERNKALDTTCSSVILKTAGEEAAGWINSNRGCFLLVNMFETEIGDIVHKIKTLLEPHKTTLAKSAYKGAEILLKKL